MSIGLVITIFVVGFCLGFVVSAWVYGQSITFLQIDREAVECRAKR